MEPQRRMYSSHTVLGSNPHSTTYSCDIVKKFFDLWGLQQVTVSAASKVGWESKKISLRRIQNSPGTRASP